MDNSKNRLHDVFFYGLYMDPEVLRAKGVTPRNPRIAILTGYQLRFGNLATLLRVENAEAHGIVYSLSHEEIHALYWGSGLDAYVAEAVAVETADGEQIAALCCNLLEPPGDDETNPDYHARLVQCMQKLGVTLPT